jgi:putative redox protein
LTAAGSRFRFAGSLRRRKRVSWVTVAIGRASDKVDVHVGVGVALVAYGADADRESIHGPEPLDLLLASLGACTAVTLKQYAAARDWPLEAIEVDLHVVSRQRSRCAERILSIQGPLDPDQREALLAAAQQSPVTLLLRAGLPIFTELA